MSCGLVLAAMGLVLAPAAGAAQPFTPFKAAYGVTHGKRSLGEAIMTLRAGDAPDVYVFESDSQARGIAKLFGDPSEFSEFRFAGQGLQPLHFKADDGKRGDKRDMEIHFDWERGVASSRYKGEDKELEIVPGVLDRALLTLALMYDLANGGDIGPYTTVDKNSLRTYEFERLGEEEVETPAGQFRAVKLRRQRIGSSRETHIWCAPELDYLAVKLQQYKDGKPNLGMTLLSHEHPPDLD